jgi:hypothetical protein
VRACVCVCVCVCECMYARKCKCVRIERYASLHLSLSNTTACVFMRNFRVFVDLLEFNLHFIVFRSDRSQLCV